MNNKKSNLIEDFKQGKYNIFNILNLNNHKNQLPTDNTIMKPHQEQEAITISQPIDVNLDNQHVSGIAVLKTNIENKFKEYNDALQFKDEIITKLYLKIDELTNINTMLNIEAKITKWKDIPNGTPVTVKFARKFLNHNSEDTNKLDLLYLCAYENNALSLQHRIIINFAEFVSNVVWLTDPKYKEYEFNWNETNAIETWIQKYYEYSATKTYEKTNEEL